MYLCSCLMAVMTASPAAVRAAPDGRFPDLARIAFHSTQNAAPLHPRLMYVPQDIDAAKQRREDRRYRQASASLDREARKAVDPTLPPLDGRWWQQVKSKPWKDTYPIIYEKTACEPGKLARPAYYGALRYALTGSKQDRLAAQRILLHLSNYSFEYEHYDVGMNYAGWGLSALCGYDLLFDTFAPEQRVQMDRFFTRMARAVLKNDIFWIQNDIGGGLNNHLAWHKMILGMLGLFYDNTQLIEYALNGPRGMLPLLDDGLVDDGLWGESSLTYHFTAIIPMVYFAEALVKTGYAKNLYVLKSAHGRSLRQAFDAMLYAVFPDLTIPPLGDTYGIRRKLSDEFCYYYAYWQYRDPRYAWLLRHAPRTRAELLFVGIPDGPATAPNVTTRRYREHGLAFLRQHEGAEYWNNNGWCALVNFGRSDVHHHQDRLSLMLFGAGDLLVPDVESLASVPHAFSSHVQRELNRSALSQNTVMVDYKNQRSIRHGLEVVEFSDRPGAKRICVADTHGALYPGVRQMRCVVVCPHYVLDVFQLTSDDVHDYHWIAHGEGRLASLRVTTDLDVMSGPLRGPGSSWLRDARHAHIDTDVSVEGGTDAVRYRLTIGGAPETELIACGYPATDGPDSALLPMVLVHRRAKNATFVAVYQADKSNLAPLSLGRYRFEADKLICPVRGKWGVVVHQFPRL